MWKIFQVAIFIFSSQVGSGVFILPAALSICGYKSLMVLLSVGGVCTLVTRVFADTGKSSHELIADAFGYKYGKIFFLLYWFISWFSTVVLFKELTGYLKLGPLYGLLMEVSIWLLVTFYNMHSFKHMIFMEGLLTGLKILPFFGLLICYFKSSTGIITSNHSISLNLFLRCLWSFVGLETGNIIARNIQASSKEREVGSYLGMGMVILFYVISVFLCFKIAGTQLLISNGAPYVTVFQIGLSNYISMDMVSSIIKYIIVLVLIGSINSWTISSGYTGYEGGLSNLLPRCFATLNKHKVPYMSIFLSSCGVLVFLLISYNSNVYATTIKFIEISSSFFLLIYGMCLWAYSKIYLQGIKQLIYYAITIVILLCFSYELYRNICLLF